MVFQKLLLHVMYFLLRRFYELCKYISYIFMHKTLLNSISYDACTLKRQWLLFCFALFRYKCGVHLHFKLKWRFFSLIEVIYMYAGKWKICSTIDQSRTGWSLRFQTIRGSRRGSGSGPLPPPGKLKFTERKYSNFTSKIFFTW